jgi:hypothetical protein
VTAPIVGPSQQSAIDFVAYDRHEALPTAKHFLIATPERMYLWRQDGANSEDAGPEFTIDAAHVLQPYFDVVDRTGARERAEAQARSFVRIIVRTCRIVGSHRNEIVALASRGRIEVAVPAFSLAEPHLAILGKEKARARLSSDLRAHLFELGRSKSHRAIPASFENSASISYRQRAIRAEGLCDAISGLLRTAHVIALDSAILRSAGALQAEYGISGQDAIVPASVPAHFGRVWRLAGAGFLRDSMRDWARRREQMKLRLDEVYANGRRPPDRRLLMGIKAKFGRAVKGAFTGAVQQ